MKKECKYCDGTGDVYNILPYPTEPTMPCPLCDGTGQTLSKGELGWGNLNDFGQEGEDITNL